MSPYVKGIDVSRWQPTVDWQKVKGADITFAVPKASQSTWPDKLFASHWAGAKSAGLLRGAYHFLTPDADPRQQAAAYLKALGSDPGELPPVLDIEAKTDNPAKYAQYAEAWLAEVEKQLNRRPIIYTAAWYWNPGMLIGGKYPDWAAEYELWVAAYPVRDGTPTLEELEQAKYKPLLPKSWTKWLCWQYSERGRVDGIVTPEGRPANVDLNIFNGNQADFMKWLGLAPAEAAPAAPAPAMAGEPEAPKPRPKVVEPVAFGIESFSAPMESYGDASEFSGSSARVAEAMESEEMARKAPAAAKKRKAPAKKAAMKPAKKAPRKTARKAAKKASRKTTRKTGKTTRKRAASSKKKAK